MPNSAHAANKMSEDVPLLGPWALRCALRTLGELYDLGVFTTYEEHLSTAQSEVAAQLSALFSGSDRSAPISQSGANEPEGRSPATRATVAARLRAAADQLTEEIDKLVASWDAVEEVDTNLGAEVHRVGFSLRDLLHSVAADIRETEPLRSSLLTRYAFELDEAVDAYAELHEHETDYSIDIFHRLGPGIGLVQRVLAVIEDPTAGERATVGEVVERLRQFPLNLEVWAALPQSEQGFLPLNGTASEGHGDAPGSHEPAAFIILGTADHGMESDRTLTLWVHTVELWRDLEAAAGLTTYALGRFKEWNALGPAYFSADDYDLDAMIAWAREQGIPHTDERAVHYSGTTGVVDFTSERLTLNAADAKPAGNSMVLPAHLQAFENAVRQHLQHPPTEWTVKRITGRRWAVVDHCGATIATRPTKKAAQSAIDDSAERRIWDQNCAWYRGESTDPRVRQLTAEEKAVVARVLIEIDSADGPSGE